MHRGRGIRNTSQVRSQNVRIKDWSRARVYMPKLVGEEQLGLLVEYPHPKVGFRIANGHQQQEEVSWRIQPDEIMDAANAFKRLAANRYTVGTLGSGNRSTEIEGTVYEFDEEQERGIVYLHVNSAHVSVQRHTFKIDLPTFLRFNKEFQWFVAAQDNIWPRLDLRHRWRATQTTSLAQQLQRRS